MTTPTKRSRLGRGLDAMLPAAPERQAPRTPIRAAIEEVHPNREQPRQRFDEDALSDLAASIKEIGILEPILVRKRASGGFEIIAGERRWRAAQRAGLHEVPIFVRELSELEAFEAALVENIQRADLNPVETARAFHRLLEDHNYSQETLATRLGKDRSTVSNAIRLLKLPKAVLDLMEDGHLSEGHGRAILSAPDVRGMQRLAQEAADGGWSVRETERRARALTNKAAPSSTESPAKSVNVRDLENRLANRLGTKVVVRDRRGKGRLELSFRSYDDLDRILEKILS